jgi:hypothetical protein
MGWNPRDVAALGDNVLTSFAARGKAAQEAVNALGAGKNARATPKRSPRPAEEGAGIPWQPVDTTLEADRAILSRARAASPQCFSQPRRERRTARGKGGRGHKDLAVESLPRCRGRLLSLDPSIAAYGWAVTECPADQIGAKRVGSGEWGPTTAKAAPDRFIQLHQWLAGLCHQWQVTMALLELPNPAGLARGSKWNKVSAIIYGMAVGMTWGTLIPALGLPAVLAVDVAAWKGRVKKGYTRGVVDARFHFSTATENEADALGLALWYWNITEGV